MTAGLAMALAQTAAQRAQPDRYIEDVKYLASPALQGRGAGTPGLELAAKYIEKRFKELGLRPAGEANSYRQGFQVTTGAKPGPGNSLEAGDRRLHLNSDYTPLSFSSNGNVQGPVVFAGYGITAPESQYDDYSHLDVKDKIVLVLRYEPKGFRKDSTGKNRAYTHHAGLVSKAINARNHGAKAVVLVNGEVEQNQQDTLIRFGAVSGPENTGILMVQVKNSIADDWLRRANKPLSEVQRERQVVCASRDVRGETTCGCGEGAGYCSECARLSSGAEQGICHHRRALRSPGARRRESHSRLRRWAQYIRARMITRLAPRAFSSWRVCSQAAGLNWREAFCLSHSRERRWAAGVGALGESSDSAARECRGHDQHGHDWAGEWFEAIHRRHGNRGRFRSDVETDRRAVSVQDRLFGGRV